MSFQESQAEPRRFTPQALVWATVATLVIWTTGIYVDSRYHAHEGTGIESFLTPQHALLYGGTTATVLVVGLYLVESWRLGGQRRRWLPPGFGLVLVASVAYFGAGGFDMLWHEAFGFEVDVEAVMSPAHVALWLCRLAVLAGLAVAALHYRRSTAAKPHGWLPRRADVPLMVVLALAFATISWLFVLAQPLVVDYAAADPVSGNLHTLESIDREDMTSRVAATAGLMFQSTLLSLFLVSALRHLRLPAGTIFIIVVYTGTAQVFITDMWRYLPAVLAAAIVGEAIWARTHGTRDADKARHGYWLIGAGVPFTLMASYFLIMGITSGFNWAIHLWAGSPVVAAVYGLLAALLVVPPSIVERLGARSENELEDDGYADARDETVPGQRHR